MILRSLNDAGVVKFESFLTAEKAGKQQNVPRYLLESGEFSSELEFELEVDDELVFKSRFELGKYLVNLLKGQEVSSIVGNTGFWTWFSLFWIDQLCPVKSGKRKVDDLPNYVLSNEFGRRQRHTILTTYSLVSLYGQKVEFMLSKPLSVRGELTEQLMGTQETLHSSGVMLLANELYGAHGGFKKGAAGKGGGSVRRFATLLSQLRLTFDIFSTTKDELAELLPSEFDRFRESAAA